MEPEDNGAPSGATPLVEKPAEALTAIRPEFIASFLSLDVSFVTNLPPAVIQKISARANEFEALKSQRLLDEVSFEQSIHAANGRVQQLEAKVVESKNEIQRLKESSMRLELEKSRLHSQMTAAQSQNSTNDTTVKALQKKLDDVSNERAQILETLDRRNKEIRELRMDLESLQNKNLDNRRTIAELENQAQKVRSEQMTAKLREQNLSQEVELIKRANEWLDSEFKQKTEEYKKFRSDKLAVISKLQSDMDLLKSEHESLERSHETLRDRFAEVSKSYDDSLVKIKDLESAQVANEEAFRKEMSSQQRLGELWEKSAKDAKARVQELERTLECERKRDIGDLAHWKSEAERYQAMAEQLRSQLDSMEQQLKEMHLQVDTNGAAGGTFAPTSSGMPQTPAAQITPSSAIFSPSAHIISEIQKGGGSLVQLYSEFQETKTRLERERHRNESLRREMDQILEEMETNAPAILAEREENRRLELELADLSVQLEKSSSELEEVRAKLKTTDVKYNDCLRENGLLSQQVRDLSRQIQHLLIQNYVSEDSEGPLSPQEHFALQKLLRSAEDNSEGQSDTDKLISQRLVLFRDIIELQKQNEYLLKVTRELGLRMEEEESKSKKRLENLESSVVEEAKTTIKSLKEQVDRLTVKSEALQRERDMFRRMLSNKSDSGEPNGAGYENSALTQQLLKQNEDATASLKELQSLLDAQRQESSSTVRALNDQIRDLQNGRSDLSVQLSKAQGQVELAHERYRNLNSNLEMLKSENEELKKRNQSLQDSVAKQDMRTQQVAEELVDARSVAESLRGENANLTAEKQLWKSIESRITQENAELLEEKGRLNGILTNMRLMESERETSGSESRRRLISQVEALEAQVSKLQGKLDKESQEARQAVERREIDLREYQSKVEKLNVELAAARESVVEARNSFSTLELKHKELEAELKAAQETVSVFQARSERTDPESKEALMSSEITSLKSELELSKNELGIANSHIKELTEVASAAEEALQSLTTTHDEFEKNMNERVEKKEAEIATLQEKLNVTKDLLDSTTQELANAQNAQEDRFAKIEHEKVELQRTVQQFQANESRLNEIHESLKHDLEKQSEIAKTAQDNYEKELVKHAEAASTAQALRAELGKLKEQVLELSSTSKHSTEQLEASEASWNSQKYAYEHEIEQLKGRCNDLALQNKMLLDQLETATTRPSSSIDDDEKTIVGSSDDQLRELVTYLKHEKEIIELNYDMALQEKKRLQQKLEHTASSLDEARLELEKERSREGDALRLSNEHQKVLQQLEDLNVLRESNSSLRSQSTYYSKKAKELEEELASLKARAEPLEERLQEAVAEIEAKDQQIALIQQDNDRWKTRSQQMLQKYQRIDPEELDSLKTNIEESKNRIESLSKEKDELAAKISTLEKEKTEAESKLRETETASSGVSEELARLQVRFENLKKESQEKLQRRRAEALELREELRTTKDDLAKAREAQQNAKLADSNDNLELTNELDKLKGELFVVQSALEASKAEAEAEMSKKNMRIAELEGEYNRVSDEVVELQRAVNLNVGDASAEVAQLSKAKSDVEKELLQLKREMESLKAAQVPYQETERKLAELTEELEKERSKQAVPPGEAPQVDREALKKELKEEIEQEALVKYKANSAQKIRLVIEKKTNEIKEKYMEEYNKKLKDKDAKIRELMQQIAAVPALTPAEELKKATEQGRASGRKEAEMRSSLLLKKLEKEKEALTNQLQALKGQTSSAQPTVGSSHPVASLPQASASVQPNEHPSAQVPAAVPVNAVAMPSQAPPVVIAPSSAAAAQAPHTLARQKYGPGVLTKANLKNAVTATLQKPGVMMPGTTPTGAAGGSKIPSRPSARLPGVHAKPTVHRPGNSVTAPADGSTKRVLSHETADGQAQKKRKEDQS